MCGSPEYVAPEIILNTGHGLEVDWWSLGILMFEFLTGYVPFFDEKSYKGTYMQVLFAEIVYPEHLSENAVDLIKKLLARNPTKRLGSIKGASEIMSHKWFDTLCFKAVENQTMQPPEH
eukprot:CAMPEP_0196582260 /NCGR_PEP_ID=MMETSP1081-20130531/38313_1 /TAXON_ID=36882 /ORGANISM="Pyramimonas amylifera, Strain CCMP720" /LENGTH=118 /DNA_ID=CAMNT_0041902771 /DNA_START=274 /DNA_END=630 /DNA_ORIENTATION=+